MKVAVYGCADAGKRVVQALMNKTDIDAMFFVDNNVEKIGTIIDGIVVLSLYSFVKMYEREEINKIIIPNYTLGTIHSMKMDLRKNGIKAEDVLILNVEKFIDQINSLDSFSAYRNNKVPYIQYISYEAAEKCNLNCKRCDHFSNIKETETSEDVEEFTNNMELLSEKVDSIGCFSFLGGEPLLNRNLDKMIYITKQFYPETQIIVLTNGILIRNISGELKRAIQETNTLVRMTLYPPLKDQIDDIVQFMRRENIRFELSKVVDEFWTQININGDSNPIKMLNRCVNSDCFIVKRGKLGKCPITMNCGVFNSYFGTAIPRDVLDLEDKSITVDDINKYLYDPIRTCAYCGRERYFDWEQTKGKIDITEMICSERI